MILTILVNVIKSLNSVEGKEYKEITWTSKVRKRLGGKKVE